jgi:hypothetical protein
MFGNPSFMNDRCRILLGDMKQGFANESLANSRCTGQTTAIALRTITDAMSNPNIPVGLGYTHKVKGKRIKRRGMGRI